jgi:tetratricopeptide (TPR) repeat protein/ubiquitin-protein ligase
VRRHQENKGLENFLACPDPDNIFRWYFLIFGLKDCPYSDGFYLGKLIFPKNYPHKPPGIMTITPNGRFEENTRICMSMSDYHPESWNPLWNVHTIVIGLISFMVDTEHTAGCVNTDDDTKRKLALSSLAACHKHDKFKELFGEQFEKLGLDKDGNLPVDEKKEESKVQDITEKISDLNMKELGNIEFKAKNFDKAIEMYSAALINTPNEHTIYGNRANAYLRL